MDLASTCNVSIGSTGEATDQDMWHLIAPPSTPDFFGKEGLNLALGLVNSCCGCQTVWWLHTFGWREGTWALLTPVFAIKVGVGLKNEKDSIFY